MKAYTTKSKVLSGTDFKEVHKKARIIYKDIKKKTKRKPYVRSAYFKKEKIFLDLFWSHLYDKKSQWDRTRRTKYFECGLELIQNSRVKPTSKENPNKKSETLHRFLGMTPDKKLFAVQIKENVQNKNKWLISIFPKKY
jgi:hypothetical protein